LDPLDPMLVADKIAAYDAAVLAAGL